MNLHNLAMNRAISGGGGGVVVSTLVVYVSFEVDVETGVEHISASEPFANVYEQLESGNPVQFKMYFEGVISELNLIQCTEEQMVLSTVPDFGVDDSDYWNMSQFRIRWRSNDEFEKTEISIGGQI